MMGFWGDLVNQAKDALAQQSDADAIVYPAGSAQWRASHLKRYHDSLEPFEQRIAEALGTIMPLRLYARLPVSQRQETMSRVSETFAAVFGFNPPAAVVIDETNRPVSWYANGLIVLNHRALVDPREALHTALHESTHAYQKKTIDQWRRGELGPQDPRAQMAPVWAYNFAHYIKPSRQRLQQYFNQPLEFHAERFAKRVLARLDWLAATVPASPPPGPGRQPDLYDMMYD